MLRFLRRNGEVTRIALDPPAAVPGRSGIGLVLIVRNEARHIGEWARFHLLAGVDRFIVYDDGSTDGTAETLRRAVPADRLTMLPWHQKLRDGRSGGEIHNQVLAYAHATRNFGGSLRWMTYLDADEFLVPVSADTIPEALAGLGACASVSLPWHMFGRNGHQAPPAGGILSAYTRRNPDPMSDVRGLRNFKAIVDPCAVTAIRVHVVETNGQTGICNDAGRTFPLSGREGRDFYSTARLQLNHYYTRSDAELRAKIARGPNLTTPDADHLRRVMRKVEAIEAGEVEDRRALDFLARRGVAPQDLLDPA